MTNERDATKERETLELVRENQARVLAGTGSPKILVGGINYAACPNFHTQHLIRLGASLVSITQIQADVLRPERLWVHQSEALPDAMRRLPGRWKPDFFWDAQVEQGHYFPIGLGDLDIPTVVSFNHAHLGQALAHLEGMFDCIIRPSSFMSRWGDAELPWGGSWGAMDERIALYDIERPEERDVTVSCTIGTDDCGDDSTRWDILRGMKRIKDKRKDWNVVIAKGLDLRQYYTLIAHSKVVVNVGTWGSPMTYRPLEVLGLDAVLVHADETGYGSEATLREFFPEKWYVEWKPLDDMEAVIEQALAMPTSGPHIRAELNERYSYKAQYTKLFDLAASVKKKPKLSLENWSRRACAINDLTGYPEFADVHRWALTDLDIQTISVCPDKEWDVCLWQPKSKEARVKWSRELALRKEPKETVYLKYAAQAAEPLAAGT